MAVDEADRSEVMDFVAWNGMFDATYRPLMKERWVTFKIALNLFLQRHGSVIVETGSERSIGHGWDGDGNSTYLFGEILARYGGRLWTCDINPEHTAVARRATEQFTSQITYVTDDSVHFLHAFDRPIDLLYLDSMDCPRDGDATIPQQHNLHELQAALPHLSPSAVILLDDNWYENGGKTRLSKRYLAERGWICLLDSHQSLWMRDECRRPSQG
ncbi:MAG TPA: class I SAM-dependent methyltransferase [Chloroflexota bacterium]|nr:class I SAM-dependent methyltransferase [Chloroflexota bacterium]